MATTTSRRRVAAASLSALLAVLGVVVVGSPLAGHAQEAGSDDPPGLALSETGTVVGDPVSAVVVTIERVGDLDGPLEARVETFDGSFLDLPEARAGVHYTPVEEWIRWESDEGGVKEIPIAIISQGEQSLTFGLAIQQTRPSGVQLTVDDQVDLVIPGTGVDAPPPTTGSGDGPDAPDPGTTPGAAPESGSDLPTAGADLRLALLGLCFLVCGLLLTALSRRRPAPSR